MKKNMLFFILVNLLINIHPVFSQVDFWQKTSGPDTTTRITALAVDNQGYLFAGTTSKVFISKDNGETWAETTIKDVTVNSIEINTDNHIFVASLGSVFRSTDNSTTWEKLNNNLNTFVIMDLIIDHNNDLFVGTFKGGVFRSTDNGLTWTEVNSGFQGATAVENLTVDNSGNILAAVGALGVFHSTDNGESWNRTTGNGMGDLAFQEITVNGNGDIFVGTTSGIFRSTDVGENWSKVYTNTSNPIRAFLTNSDNHIFAATGKRADTGRGDGIFLSTDYGDSWTAINAGLEHPGVYSLALNSDGVVFAGTEFGGVYRSAETATVVQESPILILSYQLEQNYPNPFNPTTMISYRLSSDSRVKLSVFNLLGEEVSVLVNTWQSVGSYQARFDASNLPNGVYFYKIQTKGFSETRKMLLMK